MKIIIKYLLLIISICIAVISLYKIANYIYEDYENTKVNKELANNISIENNNETQNDNVPIYVDFTELAKINKDIVGWIYLENTQINYPVLRGDDNAYYLRRMANKKYNSAGSIFMDYRNNPDFSDFNTIIYGHNMKNKSMFWTLEQYKEYEYYESHKRIFILSTQEEFNIEIIAATKISKYSKLYDFDDAELYKIIDKYKFDNNLKLEENDKFVTFSTCDNSSNDNRWVVIGRVVK